MTIYTRQNTPIIRKSARRPLSGSVSRGKKAQAEPTVDPSVPDQAQEDVVLPTPAAAAKGMRGTVMLFIFSLLFPMVLKLGPIILFPYRVLLLVMFIPLFIKLVSGKVGGILAIDWFMMASTLWAGFALLANHDPGQIIDTYGIYTLEFLGSYLIGRVGIRSAADFMYMIRLAFICIILLLPFGVVEALTDKNILLDILPGAIRDSNQGVRMGINRAQTIFAHSIHYGVFCSLLLGLTWYAFKPDKPYLRYILTLPVLAFSTFLSLATGALIAFNVQFMLILWELILKPIRKRWVIFGWLSVAAISSLISWQRNPRSIRLWQNSPFPRPVLTTGF
jgi:hypothetical protein